MTRPPPEEKLLKLIRGKARQPTTAAVSVPSGQSLSTLQQSAAAHPLVQALAHHWSKAALLLLGATVVVQAMGVMQELTQPPLTPSPVVTAHPLSATPEVVATPIPEPPLLAAGVTRSLFAEPPMQKHPTQPGDKAPGADPAELRRKAAAQLAVRLTLLGIVSTIPPQAIVEDSQTKKTYFVTTGQSVVEGAVVEEIKEGQIILDLEGEKITLNL